MSPLSASEENLSDISVPRRLEFQLWNFPRLVQPDPWSSHRGRFDSKTRYQVCHGGFLNCSATKDRTSETPPAPMALTIITDKADRNLKIQPGVQAGSVNPRIFSQWIKYWTHCKKDFSHNWWMHHSSSRPTPCICGDAHWLADC